MKVVAWYTKAIRVRPAERVGGGFCASYGNTRAHGSSRAEAEERLRAELFARRWMHATNAETSAQAVRAIGRIPALNFP